MNDQKIIDLQRKLTNELIEKGFIKTKEVERAFLTVPRHLFLPGIEPDKVYSNTAIVTKWDGQFPISSSSEPAVYAIMLEQLELNEGLKILEIGAGTGFNAALIAEIIGKDGKVITLDIDKDITDSAERNLRSVGYGNAKVICKDGTSGYEQEAPFDRIIITAGVWDISPEWFMQLKPGGSLLLPMVISFKDQMTIAFKRVDDHLESTNVSGCKFMEFRGDYAKPVNQIEVGQTRMMSLFSNFISKIENENFYYNYRNDYKDFSTGIKASLKEINAGFLPYMEITEPEFCLLALKSDAEKILDMTVLPVIKGKSAPLLYGLADKDSVCFINFTEEKASEPDSRSFRLNVRNFGSSGNLAQRMAERITKWDSSGRPGIHNLRVKAYFNDEGVYQSEDEYVISKKWTKLLFSFTNNK